MDQDQPTPEYGDTTYDGADAYYASHPDEFRALPYGWPL